MVKPKYQCGYCKTVFYWTRLRQERGGLRGICICPNCKREVKDYVLD